MDVFFTRSGNSNSNTPSKGGHSGGHNSGGGGHRVFKVQSQGEGGTRFMALKLVLPGDNGDGGLGLMRENSSSDGAAQVHSNAVAHVEAFIDFGDNGAAMLLQDVGAEVPFSAWQQLFETLGGLQEGNVVHGDPRLSNAIFAQGSVRWIDFRTSAVAIDPASILEKWRDIDILVRSCCDKEHILLFAFEYNGTTASAVTVFEALTYARRVARQQAAQT